MKVSELIYFLETMPQDYEVSAICEDDNTFEITNPVNKVYFITSNYSDNNMAYIVYA